MIRFTDSDGIEREFKTIQDAEQLASALMRQLGPGSAAVVAVIEPLGAKNETPFFYGWAGPSLSLLGLVDVVKERMGKLVLKPLALSKPQG